MTARKCSSEFSYRPLTTITFRVTTEFKERNAAKPCFTFFMFTIIFLENVRILTCYDANGFIVQL